MRLQRKPKLSARKQQVLLRRFVKGDTAVDAADEAGVDRNTANLYFNTYRELIYDNFDKAPRFYGEVEMDQAFFGQRVKREVDKRVVANPAGYGVEWETIVRKKALNKLENKIMVFGIHQRGGNVYTHIIKKADRDTLFPIIHMIVEPKTTIYTDGWKGFNDLQIDGYIHKQVNHTLGPVGRDGEHTGHIDQFWNEAKGHLRRYKGISRRTFALHLKEIEVRHNHKGKFKELMIKLLKDSRKKMSKKKLVNY